MIFWYIRNAILVLKYKLGIAVAGVDFVDLGNESNDFCIDHYYDLMASDFLSDDEIREATALRDLSDEDTIFWAFLREGVSVDV